MVYATRGLLDGLLEYARDREPEAVSVPIDVTPAGTLPERTLDPETAVFTHFYLPDAGASVRAVFGVDLGTPPGTPGRFLSHPAGDPSLTKRDDLAEVVIVAVPPWDRSSLAAYDRRGRRLDLEVLDVDPPEESLA